MTKLLRSERVMTHPWSRGGMVVNFPVWLLKIISNQTPTLETDLLCGTVVPQESVWEDIKINGMAEPLLIIIGYKNKIIRLESGNHRIKLADLDKYTHLPVALQIINGDLLNEGNGHHNICAKQFVDWEKIVRCPYPVQMNPMEIIDINKAKIHLKSNHFESMIHIN